MNKATAKSVEQIEAERRLRLELDLMGFRTEEWERRNNATQSRRAQ